MKFNKFYVSALSLAFVGGFLTSCNDNSQQQSQTAPELAVMTVSTTQQTLDSSFPTTLEGENDVEIRPQVSGFLTKVNVEEGEHVKKGQVLFTIDQVQLQAAVDQAQASVAVAQANVNTASTNANNNKILYDKNIISSSAYQTSVDALNAAKAQLQQAQASLTSARKNLSYTVVTAPVSGIVGTIDNREGSLVSPSTLLTVLSSNSDMRASFSITEKDLLAYTEGGTKSIKDVISQLPEVTLQLANGQTYPLKGKIISVSGVINKTTGSANAIALFANPDGMLRSGNTGKILLPTTYTDVMLVPQNATTEIQDMKFVFVLGDSAKVKSRPITIAEVNDGKNYIVTGGLAPGETIVAEGVGINVQDGMTITPKHNNADNMPSGQATEETAEQNK